MKFWLIGVLRFFGIILSGGVLGGFLWSAENLPWTIIPTALFLFALSVLPLAIILKYPVVLFLGVLGCIVDILNTGFPFLRDYKSANTEYVYLGQWVLIISFLLIYYFQRKKAK